MHTTSFTLLDRLRNSSDSAAWDRFVDLYVPLLVFWARQLPVSGMEPADFVHDVFIKLKQELPKFTYDPAKGKFRRWLRTVCVNHWRDHQRKRANHLAQADAAQLAALASADDGLEQFWNQDYVAVLANEAFKILEKEFDPTTRAIFIEVAMNGRSVQEVAQQFGLSPNAVSIRKFHVLRRLRHELAEFLE